MTLEENGKQTKWLFSPTGRQPKLVVMEKENTEHRLHPGHCTLDRQGKQQLLSTFARLNESFQTIPSPWALDVLTKSVVGRWDVLSIGCPSSIMAGPQPRDTTSEGLSAQLPVETPATSVFETKLLLLHPSSQCLCLHPAEMSKCLQKHCSY